MTFTLEVQQASTRAKSKAPRGEWHLCEWGELLAAVEHGLPGARTAAYRRVGADFDGDLDATALRRRLRAQIVSAHAEAKKRGLP